MKITCAASVVYAQEAFSPLGQVQIFPDRDICRTLLEDSNALIIRSKTLVTPELLRHTPVQFVATATAGMDHVDLNFLQRSGIAFAHAPGCNANAVAEYVITALLHFSQKYGAPLSGKTLGVIGVGHVGSKVVEKAANLGMRIVKHDPFLALHAENPTEWSSLEELLTLSDAVTLHVPYTTTGPFPTEHLVTHSFFSHMKPSAWFLNTARGEVVEIEALQCALEHGRLQACALDVWEHEPILPPDLLSNIDICTPHIAGYSFEGRVQGTWMCHQQLCRFLEKETRWSPPPGSCPPVLSLDAAYLTDEEALSRLVLSARPLLLDDAVWRSESDTPDAEDLRRRFDRIRRQHSSCREFAAHRVTVAHASTSLLEKAAALGFQISAS